LEGSALRVAPLFATVAVSRTYCKVISGFTPGRGFFLSSFFPVALLSFFTGFAAFAIVFSVDLLFLQFRLGLGTPSAAYWLMALNRRFFRGRIFFSDVFASSFFPFSFFTGFATLAIRILLLD
jgi:hypothetical protein